MYRSAASKYENRVVAMHEDSTAGEDHHNNYDNNSMRNSTSTPRPPFDFEKANAVIRAFLQRHPKILGQPGPDPDHEKWKKQKLHKDPMNDLHRKPTHVPYYPLVSANTAYEDAGTSNGLIMQVEMHAQVATVLAAFVFAALIAESPSQLYEGSATPTLKCELFRVSELAMSIVDQVRVFFIGWILCSFIVLLLCFLGLQEYLTTRAGRKYFRVWCPTLNSQCLWMVNTILVFLLVVPLYVVKYFGFSVIFFLTCAISFYWIATLFKHFEAYTDLASLLNNIELGVDSSDPESSYRPDGWSHSAMARHVFTKRFQDRRKAQQHDAAWWEKHGWDDDVCDKDNIVTFFDARDGHDHEPGDMARGE
ncbi:unnamed protein product [Amoebophrya sp. A120]|nr:unnamed protein product [Amoebophrya sp. A120]|eukprot:GSA120T00016987001.1